VAVAVLVAVAAVSLHVPSNAEEQKLVLVEAVAAVAVLAAEAAVEYRNA
jgi:hypothetical protein